MFFESCFLDMEFKKFIGFVFFGGGVKGMVYLGLFRAMEEYGIEVDIIFGVSVGVFIGVMYIDGSLIDEIFIFFEEILLFCFFYLFVVKFGLLDMNK